MSPGAQSDVIGMTRPAAGYPRLYCKRLPYCDHPCVAKPIMAPELRPRPTRTGINDQLNGGLMIRLDLKREPYWLDLAPGVRVRVQPCTTALVMAARASITAGDEGDDNARGAALLKTLAQVAIVEWEGIGDESGIPIAPTPERIEALLDLYPVFRAFETAYFLPALVLDQEKNACAPALNGTSAAAPNTAAAA